MGKMGKKILTFDDIEVEKHAFCQHKIPILINDIDISKTVVSNKALFGKQGFKYFIGYKDPENVRR